jgi:hypothetical protein
VEWRHDGAGNLILAGGLTWEDPPRFKLEFAAGRVEMLERNQMRWDEKVHNGADYLRFMVDFYEDLIWSLMTAIEAAERWRAANQTEAA